MFELFNRKKQEKNLSRYIAGATVKHKSSFNNLKAPYRIKYMPPEFFNKWVRPFFADHVLANNQLEKNFNNIKEEISPDIVKQMLGYFDWRSRITGAYFAAFMNYNEFEDFIGINLLKSELCFAGEGYLIALVNFNSEKSIYYLKQYLDYYLSTPDLCYDQGEALAALIWLDRNNQTAIVTDDYYLEKWNQYISDKQNWNLKTFMDSFDQRLTTFFKLKNLLLKP